MPRSIFIAVVLFFARSVASAQDCEVQTQLLLPTLSPPKFVGFGESMDMFENYLVVGAPFDNTVEEEAGAVYVYKLDNNQQWIFQAKLVSSRQQRFQYLGSRVAIDADIIITTGNFEDTTGAVFTKIFVFEKDSTGEWQPGTESYQLDVSAKPNSCSDLALFENTMAISYWDSLNYVALYEKENDTFSFLKTIPRPSEFEDYVYDFGTSISLSSDLLVVCSPNYPNGNGTSGVVHLYEKTSGTWSVEPIAKLTADSELQNSAFGLDSWIIDNTVFVSGMYYSPLLSHAAGMFIFVRPDSGWETTQQKPVITQQKLSDHYLHAFATKNFVFYATGNGSSIKVWKKAADDYSSYTTVEDIINPASEGVLFGQSFAEYNSHLLISTSMISYNTSTKNEIVDYYSPLGEWDKIESHNQIFSNVDVDAPTASQLWFGYDISSHGKYLVAGTPADDTEGLVAGAAHIFKHEGGEWTWKQKITLPLVTGGDQFGHAVAISDSVLFISAPQSDSLNENGGTRFSLMGKVFVFRLTEDGWKFHSELLAPELKSYLYFGQEICVFKNYVAITEFASNESSNIGKIHIYKESANHRWNYIATLQEEGHPANNSFGIKVVMNDSLLVAGTGNFSSAVRDKMKVFIFRKKGEWTSASEDATLSPAEPHGTYNNFGVSLDMDGDHIVVGAPNDLSAFWNDDNYFRGAAYIFKRPEAGWKGVVHETAKLLPNDPSKYDCFGFSVAIDNSDIFIGSPHGIFDWNRQDHLNNDIKHGRVYHYKKENDEWTSTNEPFRQLYLEDPEILDGFGFNVELVNRTLFVTGIFDDTEAGIASGSVMTITQDPVIVDLPIPKCIEDGTVALEGYPFGGIWTGAGIIEETSNLFDPSQLEPGIYPLAYSVPGCTAYNEIEIISSGLEIYDMAADSHLKCFYDSVLLFLNSNAENDRYHWYIDEELLTTQTQFVNAKSPATYTATISHPICKPFERSFIISDEEKVEVAVQDEPIVCNETHFQLSATPDGGHWSGQGLTNLSGDFDPALVSDGVYPLIYTSITPLGCQFSDTLNIVVDKLITPQITSSASSLCNDEEVYLSFSATPDTNWKWHHNNNIIPQATDTILTVTSEGSYFVAFSKHSCTVYTDTIELEIQKDNFFVPNVFTPNGDELNNDFQITTNKLDNFYVTVSDRYGMRVFESNDPHFRWNGSDQASGVYYWSIRYKNCFNEHKAFNGWVKLVR